jgi:hypothetical protein
MTRKPIGARLEQHAAATGSGFEPRHESSFWLRGRLTDLGTRLRSGQMEICPNLRPQNDAVAVLWAPGWLSCGRRGCVRCASHVLVTGDADRTCDRCGAVVDTIHPEIVAAGSHLLVMFGLCAPCHRREGA